MKIYISEDTRKIIRKYYNKIINYKELAIIDVVTLAKNVGYKDNVYSTYILNQEIQKQITNYYCSKRFKHLLYLVNNVNEELLRNFKVFLKQNQIFFTDFILIDFSEKVDTSIYKLFDNII